tara:strand:+ start:192 stop:494 length:303 start_codon:yes stop_codon:yes gene_type:complete
VVVQVQVAQAHQHTVVRMVEMVESVLPLQTSTVECHQQLQVVVLGLALILLVQQSMVAVRLVPMRQVVTELQILVVVVVVHIHQTHQPVQVVVVVQESYS